MMKAKLHLKRSKQMDELSKKLEQIKKEIESIESSGDIAVLDIARPSGYDD
jgi:hypothetical protein